MSASSVNSFLSLLSGISQDDQYVILCTQKSPNGMHKLWAHKSGNAWQPVDQSKPIELIETVFFDTAGMADFHLTSHPQHIGGFTYYMLVKAISNIPIGKLTKILVDETVKHDRIFSVPPDPEIVKLLETVPADTHCVSVGFTINFKDRHYAMTYFRPLNQPKVEKNIILDPLTFDMALRVKGWIMPERPAHIKGDNYVATLVSDDGCERMMINSVTDLQTYQKREQGMVARFNHQLAAAAA